jgi:aspartate/methionine/tyrosine aminotransferase
MANFVALAALVEPGNEVLVERPAYDPLFGAASFLGAMSEYTSMRPKIDGFHSRSAAAASTRDVRSIVWKPGS